MLVLKIIRATVMAAMVNAAPKSTSTNKTLGIRGKWSEPVGLGTIKSEHKKAHSPTIKPIAL